MDREKIAAVCTNDEARAYFSNKGLSYDDIHDGEILILTMLLNEHLRRSNREGETSVKTIELSRKIDVKKRTNGSIVKCFLYVNSHYFRQRECISFNEDGFIGFAGWADQRNTNPILRAFLEWCDYIESIKTKE